MFNAQRDLFYASLGIKNFDIIPNEHINQFNSLEQILEIKKNQFDKSGNNLGKCIYQIDDKSSKTRIFGKKFFTFNKKKAYLIIKNKKNKLLEKIENGNNYIFKIKFKLLDYMVNLDSMFDQCETLSCLPEISNLETKYAKNMNCLFRGCSSLNYIDDISNWNTSNVTSINEIFSGCQLIEGLPDI